MIEKPRLSKSATVDKRVRLRRARSADAKAIFGIIKENFPLRFLACSTFGYPGGARQLAEELSLSPELQEPVRRVATADGAVVGYIDLKSAGDTLFLSYIAVARRYQGQHLGSRLLALALKEARTPESEHLALDVLSENEPAKKWYHRLGLVESGRTRWVLHDLKSAAGTPMGRVIGFAAAQAAQERYGFSEFSVQTATGVRRVGRLGRTLFRVADRLGLDPELVSTLRHLDPKRRILELQNASTDDVAATDEHLAADTLRLKAPIAIVLERL